MTDISKIGEFGLIDRIQNILPKAVGDDLLLGIGDDTAVISMDDSRAMLITCDIQVEGQHFDLSHISPYQLGRRAMAVNLSDIAAMGGTPTYALVSMGLPAHLPLSDFEDIFKGMRDQLNLYRAFVIGGNLSHTSREMVIDITMMGEAPVSGYLTRSGARIGDRIFMTGNLGMSAAGYHVLKKYGNTIPSELQSFVKAHLQPEPRVHAGRAIAKFSGATAMIDLSDGIAGDLNHVCTNSGVGAELFEDKLPVTDQLRELAHRLDLSLQELVLSSGEDYELLFTAEPDTTQDTINQIAEAGQVAVTEIGVITSAKEGIRLNTTDGKMQQLEPVGWDHFKQSDRRSHDT
ncbi:MAG: thiamine-phosphate kinase [candidate division KSB1 bacterium]|nr:thiamine-phosphate kinase [candidate division KSB1 bacterium]